MLPLAIISTFPFKLCFAFTAAIALSVRGYKRKSLNLSGAVCAVLVGFTLTLANYCFFTTLLAFFASSSFWTRWKAEKKRKIEAGFKEGGQRNWMQVICNGGVPTAISIIYLLEIGSKESPVNYARDFTGSMLSMTILGALACCNGDTWSSEIGTAIGSKTPRLITTFKKVPVGTNGGVTISGTIASVIGGLLIGLVYYGTLFSLSFIDSFPMEYPPQWPIIVLGCIAGFTGSVVDSILGATMQYSGFCEKERKVVSRPSKDVKHIAGRDILDNHLVNLVSSASTGILTSFLGYLCWQYIDRSAHAAKI
eukprot:Seg2007.7 transcript_id=Seg2007.7/GoldUCD/mRNA.D3Y31 product="Transmembrane protein 19" protein_id=Seg2007.7/GoldUCD/D3Y31